MITMMLSLSTNIIPIVKLEKLGKNTFKYFVQGHTKMLEIGFEPSQAGVNVP